MAAGRRNKDKQMARWLKTSISAEDRADAALKDAPENTTTDRLRR